MPRIIGIDFSLNSPAVCAHPKDKEWSIDQCSFMFLGSGKITAANYSCLPLAHGYTNDITRFTMNAFCIYEWIEPTRDDLFFIEGYSFAAKGSRVFQIGEATGILMMMLSRDFKDQQFLDYPDRITRVSPPTVKKFATNSGRAKKEDMVEAFNKDTGRDIYKEFGVDKIVSPIDDLADAYFICKYSHNLTKSIK